MKGKFAIPETEIETVKTMYLESNMNLSQIANIYQVSPPAVANYLSNHGVHVKSRKERRQVMNQTRKQIILDYLKKYGYKSFKEMQSYMLIDNKRISDVCLRTYLRAIWKEKLFDFGQSCNGSFSSYTRNHDIINSMSASGKTPEEIATHLNLAVKTVLRHIKLSKLIESAKQQVNK